jgi:hypothetical protein
MACLCCTFGVPTPIFDSVSQYSRRSSLDGLEKSLQSEAIGSSLVPRQGKSGLFWGAGVARMKKMRKAQKRRLLGCIVLATQGAKIEILG